MSVDLKDFLKLQIRCENLEVMVASLQEKIEGLLVENKARDRFFDLMGVEPVENITDVPQDEDLDEISNADQAGKGIADVLFNSTAESLEDIRE